jgi:hypothetical protein
MKKIILCFLVSASLIACTNQDSKTEAKTETTGTVTTTGPDVDMLKEGTTAFANGDWATVVSNYADTAKSYHNIWPSNTDTTVGVTIPVIIEVFNKVGINLRQKVGNNHRQHTKHFFRALIIKITYIYSLKNPVNAPSE